MTTITLINKYIILDTFHHVRHKCANIKNVSWKILNTSMFMMSKTVYMIVYNYIVFKHLLK